MSPLRSLFLALVSCSALAAQAGDKKGESQDLPIRGVSAPPAPVLTPTQARGSFRVAAGCRLELVAAEPIVVAPVTASFDAHGRLWVVEMRSYMPDIRGEGESRPTGVIAVLEDRSGDGQMDHRTEFLSGLVLPRAVMPAYGGALVLSPPNLWFCEDRDGDGRADHREVVGDGFDQGLKNPEHAANSPRLGLDNYIYFARYGRRLRRLRDGSWEWSKVTAGGQWGLSRDDFGRWFFNNNSVFARGHLAPPHYGARNPHLPRAAFTEVRLSKTEAVWPARVNLGVNRAYRRNTLRRDGRLANFTGACGALVYRGAGFDDSFYGNLFVCEPTGNFVRRARVQRNGASFRVENAYDREEFLASTDERFRPVDVFQGPDDAIYVVDMYRGVIQHRNFVTSYLRKHVEKLDLEQPLDLGRIYRVASDRTPKLSRLPKLARATVPQLVEALQARSGWQRDTAQRLLVERGQRTAAPMLRELVASERPGAVRVQSLYTLHGLDALDRATLFHALRDRHPDVRTAAIRLFDERLDGSRRNVDWIALEMLSGMVRDADLRVRMQLAFTLGAVSPREPALREFAEQVLVSLLEDGFVDVERDAVISGLAGRELAFLDRLVVDWPEGDRGRMMRRLASCVARRRDPGELASLLARLATLESAHQVALLQGALDGLPRKGAKKVQLAIEPRAFTSLCETARGDVQSLSQRVLAAIEWRADAPEPAELDAAAAELFAHGEQVYTKRCIACHLVDGAGSASAPPLRNSEWVLGSPEVLARIVLHGVRGPIVVDGEKYHLAPMIPHRDLDDEDVAGVMTYVRRAWDHAAEPADEAFVGRVRAATAERTTAWTAEELQALEPVPTPR